MSCKLISWANCLSLYPVFRKMLKNEHNYTLLLLFITALLPMALACF